MLMVVAVGFIINGLWTHSAVLGSQSDFSSTTLLDVTNQQRLNDQETGLTLDPQLSAAAQAKAEDMVAHDYWAHTSPDGKTPWSFISASGYQYQTAGENLAYGFASAVDAVKAWMNSPEHRANILNVNYQNVGFGIASSPNYHGKGPQTVIVAEYGQPVPAAAHITFTVPETAANRQISDVRGASLDAGSQRVSRIQILTGGQAAWATLAASALAGAAFTLFITRHSLRFHRLLVKGEVFVTHHPLFDMVMVCVFTAGIVLTRTSGLIR